jgi:FkbH-like protein
MTTDRKHAALEAAPDIERLRQVKCVVWDLDNTLWDGILLEGDRLEPRADAVAAIRALDKVGILHSIASKNDHDTASAQIRAMGLDEFFLYPQINWNAKSHSVRAIADQLNLGLDAIAFVDDQQFERAEVAHALPQVLCVDPADLANALRQPEFQPRFVTDESYKRRIMYRSQITREQAERDYIGTSHDFLASLDMVFTIASARSEDLQRAEELTIRTNQLNSTGRGYTYDELDALSTSPDHLLLVASLNDRFGQYGTIGLALVQKHPAHWDLRLLLMSCRVVSRGVGTILLNHIIGLARQASVRLHADLVETGRNRMMQVTYAFAGFEEIHRNGDRITLACDISRAQAQPSYVDIVVAGPAAEKGLW